VALGVQYGAWLLTVFTDANISSIAVATARNENFPQDFIDQ
jgi:hypothetical protein